MHVRVVVADERQANFFDAFTPNGPLAERGVVENEAGTLKDTGLETNRAGRRFGSSGQHHGVNGERSTQRHELTHFAREVARKIDEARIKHEFDKLVIVAGPRMLGLLRQELSEPCQELLAGAVVKDLRHQTPEAIKEVVPRTAFFH